MNELVNEWLKKAEGDFNTAEREFQVIENPNWDAVCFHSQQAVEKLLKALLQKNEIRFSRIHDLPELLRLLIPLYSELNELNEDLNWLTIFSVEFRYPGESALKEDAEQAVEIMKRTRNKMFRLLK